jgi:RNA polymerase sigma factor (sigma-70 family)
MENPEDPSVEQTDRLTRLFGEHHKALIRFLRSRGAASSEAEDFAQEAYEDLLRCPERFSQARDPKRYLWGTAARAFIEFNKKRVREARKLSFDTDAMHEGAERPTEYQQDPILEGQSLIGEMSAALNEMPEEEKTFLWMNRVGEMTSREIARREGLKKGHVQRTLTRARSRIDSILGRAKQGRVCK